MLMNKSPLLDSSPIEQAFLAENIFHSLQSIQLQLEKEIISKQRTIERQEQEIQNLRTELDQRNTTVLEINSKLRECHKQTEGNRQLVNKLLNDIDRLQNDVAWYKRTYESRSLLGTLKQKLFRK
jgi:chromosome segregation ATPase